MDPTDLFLDSLISRNAVYFLCGAAKGICRWLKGLNANGGKGDVRAP